MRSSALRKLAMGFGLGLLAAGLLAAWAARRAHPPSVRHSARFRLDAGGRAPSAELLNATVAALNRRLDALEEPLGLDDAAARPLPPDGAEVTFSTRHEPAEVLSWAVMPGRIEFRLLHPDPSIADGARSVPPGYETVAYTERQYRLSPPREVELVEHGYAVQERPVLVVDRLREVEFQAVGIHKLDVLTLYFGDDDGRQFARLTALHAGRTMAMLVDGEMFFPPKQIESAITDGAVQVEGYFHTAALEKLAAVLASGALPARLELVSP